MSCIVFIHNNDEIIEKTYVDISDGFEKLYDLYKFYKSMDGVNDTFCFDVMITEVNYK